MSIVVLTVPATASDAMSDYANRRIVSNTDPVLARPWSEKPAVHGGDPGHALQFSLRDRQYDEGTAPADGLHSVHTVGTFGA